MSSIPVNWIAANERELSKRPAWRGRLSPPSTMTVFVSGLQSIQHIPSAKVNGGTDDEVSEAFLELDFKKPVEVNAVLIQEFIPLGQRVKSFSIDAYIDDAYDRVAKGVTIGNRRIVKFETVDASRLRISLEAKACPLIANIEVYRIPDI